MAGRQGDLRLTAAPARIVTAAPGELDVATLYAILALRARVFVVEQQCAFLDLDGRDLDPATRHHWIPHRGAIGAYLRVLAEPPGHRIGRVVTAPEARGRGLAAELVAHVARTTGRPLTLDAQSRLVDWYRSLGFAPDGPEFLEDGILHTPMRASGPAGGVPGGVPGGPARGDASSAGAA